VQERQRIVSAIGQYRCNYNEIHCKARSCVVEMSVCVSVCASVTFW